MAVYTILLPDPAQPHTTTGVTRHALCIVSPPGRLEFTVRIVTRRAPYAIVTRIEALTQLQAIRLKAHVQNAPRTVHGDIRPRPVAAPAELRHGFRVHASKPPHSRASFPGTYCAQMLFRPAMTGLALHARHHVRQGEFRSLDRVGRMAPEATDPIRRAHEPSCCLCKVARRAVLRAHCEIEVIQSQKIAHPAFNPLAIALKHVRQIGRASSRANIQTA